MTPLQSQILATVAEAGQKGVSLDEIAGEDRTAGRSWSARRAAARSVLRRLGAEGLVESLDGGESWRAVR